MTNTNAENLAKVREAMNQVKVGQVADQVANGGAETYVHVFDYTSPSGNEYKGAIEFKRPNMKDIMRIGGLKAQTFADAGITDLELVDSSVRLLGHITAYLKVVVVKSPPWFFNIDEIADMDIIYEVYEAFREWEDSFRRPISETQASNSEQSEDPEALDS